ncbi:rap guanine nucleotide exchange factor 4 [Exophiala viscosa]|uniref:rap guanine nucleotide exchange factor 4 n=1 Tax=Exophiala viscosa TaxID=2486360 RepID=UPI0021982AEB|nr:rap guanine nucleotide exchange factor 4 [Exophiala viscosa]
MENRSTKYRSLEAKAGVPSTKSRERHNSVPSADRRKDQQSKQVPASTTSSDNTQRSAKSRPRQDWATSPDQSTITRHSDRQPQSKLGSKTSNSNLIPSFNFLVLGSVNSGKSTFVKHAIDREGRRTSTQVTVKDSSYRVHFIELDLDDVDFSSERRLEWPTYLNGAPFPEPDGVFCLYSVSDKESVADIPTALTSMTNTGLPCMLVASKCDIPQESRQVNPHFLDQVRRNLASVAIAEVSFKSPQSIKLCLLNMINRVITSPRASGRTIKTAQASAQSSSTQRVIVREQSPKKSRSRSRSNSRLQTSKSKELLLNLSTRPAVIESGDENESSAAEDVASPPRKTRLRLDTTAASRSQARRAGPHTPMSSGDYTNNLGSPPEPTTAAVPETPDSYYVKSILRPPSSEGAESRAFQSFLNMDDDHNENSARSEIEQLGPPLSSLKIEDKARHDAGVSFKELVEKLLILPANKVDSKFVPSFLCLYRAFATPQKLLAAVIDQFVAIEKSNMVHFSKVAEMLRYLQVLAQWTATYPGDFAEGPARDLAVAFVQNIEKSKVFAPAAREISNNLDTLVPDEDAEWAYNDAPSPRKTPTSSSGNLQALHNELPKQFRRVSKDEDDSEDEGDGTNSSAPGSNAPSASSSIIKPYNSSSQSASNFAQLENAKVQADRLKLIPHIRLSKMQWHQFMEIPVEDLAKEITRIDWTMYSAIRPRDFVRHVFLSTEQRRRSRTVDNISAMVKHFNHLALFVSGMVLLRDKPEHRARALEKFMALAWKVRQLNNYNSLGAIVAGITGHEIARLTATRDIVPPEVQKQFLRLTILMGTSRSHAAYRMAWDNSFQERIPFLPLVRQDLTMAASANQTFINNNVNWKKFEIMGEVIVGLQKSLETPYTFPQRSNRTEEITRLLLETKILEESEDSADPGSELYDRSVQVEPQNGVDQRKKFDWLRRS